MEGMRSTKFSCFEPVTGMDGSEAGNSDYLGDIFGTLGFDERGISEYWRKNISHTESAELANVLRALRKVAGHIGRNVGRIEWAGMSKDGEGSIVLDPGMLGAECPISSRRFDYLVGLVTHEAIHRTEWSDLVWKKVEEGCQGMRALDRVIFQKIVYTGEDIYVDHVSGQSILGSYTLQARSVEMEMVRSAFGSSGVTVDELIFLWWESAFGDGSDFERRKVYERPLFLLEGLTGKLLEASRMCVGVTRRCEFRSRLYHEIWEEARGLIGSWAVVDKTLLWYPSDTRGNKVEVGDGKSSVRSQLSKEVALDVEKRLAIDSVDITPIILSVVGDDEEDEVVPTSKWDFNMTAHPMVDHRVVARLKGIFQSYAERKTVINRGLTYGKVDRRRLYRAPISGRCFLEKQKIPVLDWNICLLIDASGSMKGRKWRMVENTMANIHRAFRGFQNRLQAYAYFEVEGICMISRLIIGDDLLSVPPSGQTASGQAIIAAAYFMPKDTRRRFLIHITDGQSNLGCKVQCGLDYCRAQGIHLVTLGVAYKERDAMERQYGKSIQFLDHFGQLPAAFEKLLRWTLLYEKKTVPKKEITNRGV